jgi:hypothetical protein
VILELDKGWRGIDGYYGTAEEARESFWREGNRFEREIGALLGQLGAKRVIHNAVIDGVSIDLLLEQELPTGNSVFTIVECKDWKQPVDVPALNVFISLFRNLHDAMKVDAAIMVSASGFTTTAHETARSSGIRLLDLRELGLLAAKMRSSRSPKIEEQESDKPYVFVVMPFDEKFEDIYHFGIRQAIQNAGMVCKRADEILHTGNIIERIEAQISLADIIVADTTDLNPNVFYEIGIAHTLGKPVVLLVQDAEQIPFDLRNQNHIVYKRRIKLLHERLGLLLEKLKKELKARPSSKNSH